MQVFIVMVESIYNGSSHWQIDRIFSTMDSAKAYIAARKSENCKNWYSDRPEYQIEVEKVFA